MNFGLDLDDDLQCNLEPIVVEKLTVEKVLSCLGSGLGLDIAKNHTGICVYQNGTVERYGFELDAYSKDDYFADYRMRLNLKQKLKEIIGGMHFNYCIVEDVYGGENYDTVRKLIVLNTVIDELIFDGSVKVDNFYRWVETKWMRYFSKLHESRKGLKSKFKTQEILCALEDTFYLENKDLSESAKKKIFFEDKCDATAMLCGLAMYVSNPEEEKPKTKKLTLKDIKMYYVADDMDYLRLKDEKVRFEDWVVVKDDFSDLREKIIEEATKYPKQVISMALPSYRLGRFGMEQGFTFYPDDEGVLIWYSKK